MDDALTSLNRAGVQDERMRELLKTKGRSKAKAAAAPASSAKADSTPAVQSAQEQFRALPKVCDCHFLLMDFLLMHAQSGLHLFGLGGLGPLVSTAAAVVVMHPFSTCSSVFPLTFMWRWCTVAQSSR